jgi:choline dehydrogenase-like flavoprotein
MKKTAERIAGVPSNGNAGTNDVDVALRADAFLAGADSEIQEQFHQLLKLAAEIHFAAGAKRVMTLHSQKTEFISPGEIDNALASAEWGTNEIALYSAHPLGTCRMAEHPLRSVVNSHCETHDVKGLFVIDGSETPTSLGVNPQMTILAIAEKNAEWIAENRLKKL